MAKRNSTRKLRILNRAYAPVRHAANATGNSIKEITGATGNIISRALKGATRLGNAWVKHTNMAIANMTRRRRGGSRRAGRR